MLKVKVDSDGERGDMDMIIMVELLCIHDSILTAQRCSAVLSDLQNQWITHTQTQTGRDEQKGNKRADRLTIQDSSYYVGGRFISHYCFISNKPLEFISWHLIIKQLVKLNSETIDCWFIPALSIMRAHQPAFYYVGSSSWENTSKLVQKDSSAK